jgi:hypothetical protein
MALDRRFCFDKREGFWDKTFVRGIRYIPQNYELFGETCSHSEIHQPVVKHFTLPV